MVQENEIIMLLFGAGFLLILIKNNERVTQIPKAGYLLSAYYILLAGWVLTVCEAFFLYDIMNFMEHACYAVSALISLIWCIKAFAAKGGQKI